MKSNHLLFLPVSLLVLILECSLIPSLSPGQPKAKYEGPQHTAELPGFVKPHPTPTPCFATSSIQSSFNGVPMAAGDSIWFNANFKASGIPPSGATISFSSLTITSFAFMTNVPNGVIIFSPTATCATTTFSNNTWTTTVPISGSGGEIFLSGVALPLPLGLLGGVNPVVWSGIFSASEPGISVHWKWAAAVYTCFPPPNDAFYNSLQVKPTHGDTCNFDNGDHAGTPENGAFRQCVTGGATGGGGSNFTGSFSATGPAEPCVP